MYADNTHLTYADKDVNIIQSCLNEDLQNISKWLIANKTPVLNINGTPVNQVSTSKSQGVLIDANLTWCSHIERLARKIASGIAATKRVR